MFSLGMGQKKTKQVSFSRKSWSLHHRISRQTPIQIRIKGILLCLKLESWRANQI